jgi:hypothetical protein
VLHASLFGFLPADDPRMVSTLDRVIEELGEGEVLVHRYDAAEVDDGLSGPEGAFLLSSCWRCSVSLPVVGALVGAGMFFVILVESVPLWIGALIGRALAE